MIHAELSDFCFQSKGTKSMIKIKPNCKCHKSKLPEQESTTMQTDPKYQIHSLGKEGTLNPDQVTLGSV